MKLVVLDAKTLGKDAELSGFKKYGEVTFYKNTTQEDIIERLKDADIAISNKVKINKKTMESCPNLKLICITATGMDIIDLEAAKKRDIEVKNVAGYSTHSVAQHTFALVLELLTHVSYYDKFVKDGGWIKSAIFTHIDNPIREIYGKKWGIIGFGAIGKEVAKIAQAFGADVWYYSTSGKNQDNKFPNTSLEELLSKSDIVSIHAPKNDKTRGLIGKKELDLMKKDALLINVGRGGIIDEVALKDALENEQIYAGLDVLEIEPMSPNAPLKDLKFKDRLVITPHVAWASIEARKTLIEKTYKNIEDFLQK